ncbi:MAG: sigma-70 region 4 domain-containing protein [Nanoarchaeota archaeon]|nr:sigma-70 region 4 domain-containing protein [Nanoarchaeota archaeon]
MRISSIPISVLRDRSLKPLEAIVEYLKDIQGLTYHEIAELLNRDDRTIWTVYNRAKKKRGSR